GVSLNYVEVGSGSETIVFSHGYLMSHRMYDEQIAALSSSARVIAFDHRCHGASESVRTKFGMYDLVDDTAALIRETCEGPVHFVGMSTGGFVGMRLTLRQPELIKSLVLIDTSADHESPEALRGNKVLLVILGLFGFRPVINKAMSILMGAPFLNDPNRKDQVQFWKSYIMSLDRQAIRQFGYAIFSRDSVLDDLKRANDFVPTQIIVGELDQPTPMRNSTDMLNAISGSELTIVPNAGHTSPVEEPQIVTDALHEFYERIDAFTQDQ
ncbi:MAG: alpha/beta hydrolase, partial [Pseudomonadota bacterium]